MDTSNEAGEQRIATVRRELAILARRAHARDTQFLRGRPCRWHPTTVRSTDPDFFFTEVGAWEFIADLLESGHELREIELRHPLGKRAYVMIVQHLADHPSVYIKLQLGAGKIIGRSFHYANEFSDDD